MGNPYITKIFHFCAAHQYGHQEWTEEKNWSVFGLDSKPHGHNYALEVTVTGEINPDTGFLIDLEELKRIVRENVLDLFDHARIDKDLPWFADKQPSSENMVIFIWEQIEKELRGAELYRVRLRETPTIFTDYYGSAR